MKNKMSHIIIEIDNTLVKSSINYTAYMYSLWGQGIRSEAKITLSDKRWYYIVFNSQHPSYVDEIINHQQRRFACFIHVAIVC